MKTYEPVRYITIDNKKLPKDISDDVTDFSYEDSSDKMDELKLTIRDPELKHIDDPLLKEGRELCARWGYLGNLTEMHKCTIKEIEYNFPEDGEPTISLVALDKSHKLTGRSARTCWKGKNTAQVVKDIAQKHGLKADVKVPEDAPREFTSQGGKNDLVFLKGLADEMGCVMQVRNDRLIFRPENPEQAPTFTFNYRTDADGYLVSLSVKTDTEKGKGAASETEVSGVDMKTGEKFIQKSSAAESKYVGNLNDNNTFKLETAKQAKHDETGKAVSSTAADPKSAKAAAKSKARQSVTGAITADAEFIGMPSLAASQIIIINGIGKRLSGKWRVDSVTHKIGDGYSCSAILSRNDINSAKSGKKGNTPGKSNGNSSSRKAGGNKNTETVYLDK